MKLKLLFLFYPILVMVSYVDLGAFITPRINRSLPEQVRFFYNEPWLQETGWCEVKPGLVYSSGIVLHC